MSDDQGGTQESSADSVPGKVRPASLTSNGTNSGPCARSAVISDIGEWVVGQALAGQPVTVAGDGDRTHPLCYVDDMVDGVLRVAAGTGWIAAAMRFIRSGAAA